MNLNAQSFEYKKSTAAPVSAPIPTPPVPVAVVDPLTKKIAEHFKISEEHVKSLKELIHRIAGVKNDAEARSKILGELKTSHLCTQVKPAETSYWKDQIDRKSEMVPFPVKSGFAKGTHQPQHRGGDHQYRGGGRGRGHYNQDQGAPGQGDGFQKGVSRPNHYNNREPREPQTEEEVLKRGQADELRKKLAEESKRVIEKTKSDKNVHQKIRLIVNLITPDNFERKFEELRVFMFGDHKLSTEEGYDPEVDTLTDVKVSDENL